jgi:methionyl-tRNA formyltransferase
MDEGLDSGPIILVRELSTCPPQSYEDVRVALYRLAQDVMVEAITRILERGLTPADLPPQPPGPVFKPIPDHLLEEVRAKLRRGEYHPAAGLTT